MNHQQDQLIKKLIQQTFDELNSHTLPQSRTRVSNSPSAYKFLVQWSNAVLLRVLIKKSISAIKSSNSPLNSPNHAIGWKLMDRTEAQVLDACRSVIANIEEGFGRPTTSEYLQFLGYSQGSLKEVKGDIERLNQDNLICSKKASVLKDLGIDLKKWNTWCRDPKNTSRLLYFPLSRNKGEYRILKDITGNAITFEELIELINKTDYLLRTLVVSLESKLHNEKKAYQMEQARIRSNIQGYR
jgi:four helix bundle protein